MCDTAVALAAATKDKKLIFAKNSDRSPNEPHLLLFEKAREYGASERPMLKATYIELPQAERTFAALLLCPSWTWGCEMGINEHGVCIGNEAVFTKGRYGEKSLIGMDYCRLVLERCATALDGVKLISSLLETYSQGGNCGFDHEFFYDNSYLIADKTEAYILETAGKSWAARRAREVDAISNELVIEDDYELCSDDIKGVKSFKGKFSDLLFSNFCGAISRRFLMLENLIVARDGQPPLTILGLPLGKMGKTAPATGITPATFEAALRCHSTNSKKTVESPCMHYGDAIGDQTTGSMVAVPEDKIVWLTGSSTPCRAVFKPFSMKGELPLFDVQDRPAAELYWYRRELIQRNLLSGVIDFAEYDKDRAGLEARLAAMAEGFADADAEAATRLNRQIAQAEEDFVDGYVKKCETDPERLRFKYERGLRRRRWLKKNAVFCEAYAKLAGC